MGALPASGMFVCHLYVMPGPCISQRRVPDPLEFKLQMVVSCHVAAEKPGSFARVPSTF